MEEEISLFLTSKVMDTESELLLLSGHGEGKFTRRSASGEEAEETLEIMDKSALMFTVGTITITDTLSSGTATTDLTKVGLLIKKE